MKIVVIIVTYNGMKWYRNCFDSLRTSSIPLDIIVIDNNSSDDTTNFIKTNYPEIHIIESKVNLGFGKANNIGFRYAIEQNADYIYLLNQDAWIKPDTIEILTDAMLNNSSYGIISPIHISADETKIDYNQAHHVSTLNCPQLTEDILLNDTKKQVYQIAFVNAAHWLISAKCLKNVGGFSSLFFVYGEDNDYISRTVYWGYDIGICPLTYAIHDRELEDRSRNENFARKVNTQKIRYLYVLSNVNKPISFVFRDILIETINDINRNILYLKFRTSLIYIIAFLKTLTKLRQVKKHRKLNRQKGAYL